MTQRSARPCPGPHRGKEPPLTAQPLCDFCKELVRKAIKLLPEQYVAAYLALEPGQRGRDDDGGRRSRSADAPLPLDAEADALMRRILEVVLSWHGPVVAAAKLAHTLPTSPRMSTSGVALSSTCALLAAHLDTLLALPTQPMTRSVPRGRVRNVSRAPIPSLTEQTVWTTVTTPLLADDTLGRIRADGRAIVIADLSGVDAGLEMLELVRDAERTLGRTQRSTPLDRPCPGCDEVALVLGEGDDFVRCTACGEKHWAADYPRLAVVLANRTGETIEAS